MRVRSPHATRLRDVLQAEGVTIGVRRAGRARDGGSSTDAIGERAAAPGLTLHELSTRQASLEDAFMELTRDAVEYEAVA